jgi:type VI protein secretion system component Hcp
MNLQKKLALGLAAALAALVAGSIAWASVPDPRGMITGCYDKQSGELRVTDSQTGQPKGCSAKELQLLWNQQGPQGVPGPQGAPGPQGPSGGTPAPNTEVVGQVTVAGVKGAAPMAIRGFSWGASTSDGGAGGGAGGKTTIDDVTLVRTIDAATPALVGDALSGLHHQSAVIDLFVPGTQTAYVRYALTDVLVAKIAHDGDDETFSLRPAQITEQTLAGAPPPTGAQIGSLTLDGYADVLPISGDGFEIDGPSGLTPATIHPLRIDLALGASAPKLALDTMTGIHRKTATVQTSKATYHLTDVVIRSVHDEATGTAGSLPTERITLDAAQVQVTAP